MQIKDDSIAFDKPKAKGYDNQFAKLMPMKAALHLCMRLIFTDLPDGAHVLCVGAGTGDELLHLAQAYPTFRFTAVDPAGAMLDICREKADAAGITDRCAFFEGYLDALPETAPFDAATSILVSHFLMDPSARTAFFAEIASRLKPGGMLVSADISGELAKPAGQHLMGLWLKSFEYAGMQPEKMKSYKASLGKKVSVLAPDAVANIIAAGGFDAPTLFFQTLFIHGWATIKAS